MDNQSDIKTFWIIGAGRFGQIAAERLGARYPLASILVVDRDMEALRSFSSPSVSTVHRDGVDFLVNSLSRDSGPTWLVPAVPVHLAYLWLKSKIGQIYKVYDISVPEEVERSVPNPYPAENGTLYASYADFICPDNCPEPKGICTVTGKKRKGVLYHDFRQLKIDGYIPIGIRSCQLAPGVGGYKPGTLWSALEKVGREGAGKNYLIGTACLCHGVLDAFHTE